jgi:hypothetical protein
MTMMPSWHECVPDHEHARHALREAIEHARTDARLVFGLAPADAAVALGAAAADAARVSALLHPRDATNLTRLYEATLRAVVPTLERAAAAPIAGVLSFVNVVVTHRDALEAPLERGFVPEVAWLDGLAADGRLAAADDATRSLLSYAALALARVDLARAFSSDERLGALADALESRTSAPFYDFLAHFPSAEGVGHAELAFAARAFAVHVKRVPLASVGQWLHRAIHAGPAALHAAGSMAAPVRSAPATRAPPVVARKAAPAARAAPSAADLARAEALFGGPLEAESFAATWSSIQLEAIDAQRGGRTVSVRANGEIYVVEVTPAMEATRFFGNLRAEALRELDELVVAHDPRLIRTTLRSGAPDEARVALTFATDASTTMVGKWSSDEHPDFDPLLHWLDGVGAVFSSTSAPLTDGL